MPKLDLSVIVPTFNEAENVSELVARIEAAVAGLNTEIVFVDDSTDGTPAAVLHEASLSPLSIRLIHREVATGGLSGAVVVGLEASRGDWCVVMDGDLQHPPELIPVLIASGESETADVVVASRHIAGGADAGLNGLVRHLVSTGATALTRAMFPIKLRNCTDPMTGFFALRRSSIDLETLRPRGFKILLEILARTSLTVVEEPFVFAERHAGQSKADFRQGVRFLTQIAALRFGRLSGFAAIGALGAVANLVIMAGLQALGVWYLAAAIAAAVITIVGNFLLLERFVFHDLRDGGRRSVWRRFAQSVAFNGSETAVRTGVLFLLVEATAVPGVLAQALLLAMGFVIRFVYHSRVVYRPKRTTPRAPSTRQVSASQPDGTLTAAD
jgi:dolichol-phosphate mannosyltransferase